LIDKKFSIYQHSSFNGGLVPLSSVAIEVKRRNTGLIEENLLSLSYGKIVNKDINSEGGLLPASFDGYNIIEPGDIVLRLTDLQNDKRSLRTGLAIEKGIITSAYTTLRPINVEPRWLAYTLYSYDIQKIFYSLGSGLRQSMNFSDLKNLPVYLPTIEEQRRVCDFLDDQIIKIETLVSIRNKQISATQEFTRSLLSEIFLECPGERISLKRLIHNEKLGIWGEEVGQAPFEVFVARVADFNRRNFTLGEVITARSIEDKQFSSRRVIQGDILLERSGGGAKSPVGCAVQVKENITNLVCSNFVSRIRAIDGVAPDYLSMVLAALYANGQQAPHSAQTTGIQNLNTDSYFQIKVPKLTISEQLENAIAGRQVINDSAAVLDRLENFLSLSKELKSSLITSAITGQFDINTKRSVA
jgi:type I restriction enzyme S subunit